MILYTYRDNRLVPFSRMMAEKTPTEKNFPQFAFEKGYSPHPTAILGDPFAEVHVQLHNAEPEEAHLESLEFQFLLQMFVGTQSFGIFIRDLPGLLAFMHETIGTLQMAMDSLEREEWRIHLAMHGGQPDRNCRHCAGLAS